MVEPEEPVSRRAKNPTHPAIDVDTVRDLLGLPVELPDIGLDRLFSPRTVAVLGASDVKYDEDSGRFKNNTIMYGKVTAFAERTNATIYPVNPSHDEVDGRTCYQTFGEVPEPVDVAVVLVGDALEAMRQLAAGDPPPRFAIVFSAGFAESGEDGTARQTELARIAAEAGIRLLGPNTNLSVFELPREDVTGPRLALVSQSGQQGRPIFQAQDMGTPLSRWISTGNEADLEAADFINYFATQDDVATITGYIESFSDGRALMLAADAALRKGVPIVLVKVGRTDEGASMATSHTGHLAGSDAVASAVLRQYGVIRVDDMDELLETSILMARADAPRSAGVAVYSISGGTAAHTADLAAASGLNLPELTEETQEDLREWIAAYLRISNPVDSGGAPAADWRGRKIIRAIADDPGIGVLICAVAGSHPPMTDQIASDLVAVADETDTTIVAVWGSPTADEAAYRDVLLGSSVPVFRSARNCVRSIRAYLEYHERRRSYSTPFEDALSTSSTTSPEARRIINGSQGALSEHDAKQVLQLYGIGTPPSERCTRLKDALGAAEGIGYPVVLKADSPSFTHKTEHGLVKVGIANETELRETWEEMQARLTALDPDGTHAMTVSEQLSGGVETIVGVSPDRVFGPAVMFGLGGIFVEILNDVTFRVMPFNRDEAITMLDEVAASPLLHGARGREPVDVDALVDVIMNLQKMYGDLADVIHEVDVNPLLVQSHGAVALDALITTSPPADIS